MVLWVDRRAENSSIATHLFPKGIFLNIAHAYLKAYHEELEARIQKSYEFQREERLNVEDYLWYIA